MSLDEQRYVEHQELLSAALEAYWQAGYGHLPLASSERMAAALDAVADAMAQQVMAALRAPPRPSAPASTTPHAEDSDAQDQAEDSSTSAG